MIKAYDKKRNEIAPPLKVCIAERCIVGGSKLASLLKVFQRLNCKVVETVKTEENPHGFLIEMD